MTAFTPLSSDTLPASIRARVIEGVNGMTMHILEAGFEVRSIDRGAIGRSIDDMSMACCVVSSTAR
jgi:hypothetical protein